MVYHLQAINVDTQETNELDKRGIYVFLVLNLVGGVGMLAMLLTAALSPKVNRLPTWYSFCASWALSSLSYTLLFVTAQQFTTTPIYSVCYIQAALIYAIPPTTSAATLALLAQILWSLPDTPSDRWKKISLPNSCLLVMAPYSIFLILFIIVALYETNNPMTLIKAPQGTYCSSNNKIWPLVSFSFVAGISLLIILVEGRLIFKLYRDHLVARITPQSISTTIRGVVFTLLAFVSLVLAIVFVVTADHDLPFDIALSTFPFLALLVFGTQKDMLMTWFVWKSSSSYRSENRGSILFGRDLVRV